MPFDDFVDQALTGLGPKKDNVQNRDEDGGNMEDYEETGGGGAVNPGTTTGTTTGTNDATPGSGNTGSTGTGSGSGIQTDISCLNLKPADAPTEGGGCWEQCQAKEKAREMDCDILRRRVENALMDLGCPSDVTPKAGYASPCGPDPRTNQCYNYSYTNTNGAGGCSSGTCDLRKG
jgi:hypothetical protein